MILEVTNDALATTAALRLDQWLATQLPELTRSRVQQLIAQGAICFADGSPIGKPSQAPKAGMAFRVEIPPPAPTELQAEDIALEVLYEDGEIIVINKPAGLVVHPACGHDSGTLVHALLHHCPDLAGIGGEQRPGIVHRLDKDTSGVMIIAKTERAMTALSLAFHDHTDITKEYLAVTHGVPRLTQGRIENAIGRHPVNRKKMAVVQKGGKVAITNYHVIKTFENPALAVVQCQIETGRTHQIRVHLAGLQCPIIGDTLYGKSALDKRLATPPTRQLLHARRLALLHPVTREPLTFIAPIPADLQVYIGDLPC